jgi:inosine-uridine nucleoside N-ribohydrolase
MACVVALFSVMFILASVSLYKCGSHALPKQILMDTDMDTDDLFAILYLLKQNRSEVNLKAITISADAWSNIGHAVNHLYDLLYMMGRDDIQVGIGGEGGILFDDTILPDVGGYLSLAE